MFKKTDEEIIKAFDNAKTREDIANLLEINERSLRYLLFVIRPENMYKFLQYLKDVVACVKFMHQ